MASKYEITPLNSNKTILMIVKNIEKHLHDNPLYKVYFADASYSSGTLIYDVDDVSIPDGDELTTGDIVVFNNCYYAEIDAVGTETYTIKNVVLFKGDKGDTGEKGETGDTGATGNGIASIEKTGTSGNVDTYTITYTNGDTDTFTITNAPQTITASTIDSESATNGQVLTADGSGGSSWQNAQGGSGLTKVWEGSVSIPNDSYADLGAQGSLTLTEGKIYALNVGTTRARQLVFGVAFLSSGKWGLRVIADFTEESYGLFLKAYIYIYPSNSNVPQIRSGKLLSMQATGGSYGTSGTYYPTITEIYEV